MTDRSLRIVGISATLMTMLAAGRAEAVPDVSLRYVSHFEAALNTHHIMGIEVLAGHYGLISRNSDLLIVDLETLPAGGTQEYLTILPGLDAYNTVTLDDEYVYVNLRQGGTAVVRFDVTGTKPTLTLIDIIEEAGVFYEKMCIVGNRLYVPAHAHGIRIFDITNPADPNLVGSLTSGFVDAFSIAVDGDTAYVADGAGGLKIVDISNESAPVIIAGEDTTTAAATAEDILIANGQVYMACGVAGVATYPLGSVPGRVLYDTPKCARMLSIVGDYLAVADIGGVEVFAMEGDGTLSTVAGEGGTRRMWTFREYGYLNWPGVAAWGEDRLLAATFDTLDVYDLVTPDENDVPDILASTQRVYFDVGGGTAKVTLTNAADGVLEISDIYSTESEFTVSPTSGSLAAGETMEVNIEYSGAPSVGHIHAISNDPNESTFPIELLGESFTADIGEPAPQFVLPSWMMNHATGEFEYGTFDLSDRLGKVVFLHIFVTWCPTCTPALADVQNSVFKEFENDDRVAMAVMSQGELKETLEEYWRNIYLRGQMLFDAGGHVGHDLYDQALTSTPAGRAVIIGPDGKVEKLLYGYHPQLAIDTIHALLGDEPACAGDTNGDGVVDPLDAGFVLARLGCAVGQGDEQCDLADANLDALVDPLDVGYVLSRFGACP